MIQGFNKHSFNDTLTDAWIQDSISNNIVRLTKASAREMTSLLVEPRLGRRARIDVEPAMKNDALIAASRITEPEVLLALLAVESFRRAGELFVIATWIVRSHANSIDPSCTPKCTQK